MHRLKQLLKTVSVLGLIAQTACCPGKRGLIGNPGNPYPINAQPMAGEIVHLPTGKFVDMKEMLTVAGDSRIVYVGETHDNPASHRLELQLLKGLEEKHPGRVALGMEMFARSQQPVLDRWIAGKLNEEEFLRESRWYDNWKMDFAYYRDLLDFARERKIPVIALNAEKKLVEEVRKKSLDQLSAADKALLPEMDMSDPYQRAMTAAYFTDPNHGDVKIDGFIRVQTLWDETMAESAARYLEGPEGKKRKLLVVAGGNHVNYGYGIPRRAFRRIPTSHVTIGGKEIRIPKGKEKMAMNVSLPSLPMVPYDFLAYIDYEELPKSGIRLGVMIEPDPGGNGLIIREAMTGSIADKAGLVKGDILMAAGDRSLRDNLDLIYFLKDKHPGDRFVLKIERGGKTIDKEIHVPPEDSKNQREIK